MRGGGAGAESPADRVEHRAVVLHALVADRGHRDAGPAQGGGVCPAAGRAGPVPVTRSTGQRRSSAASSPASQLATRPFQSARSGPAVPRGTASTAMISARCAR